MACERWRSALPLESRSQRDAPPPAEPAFVRSHVSPHLHPRGEHARPLPSSSGRPALRSQAWWWAHSRTSLPAPLPTAASTPPPSSSRRPLQPGSACSRPHVPPRLHPPQRARPLICIALRSQAWWAHDRMFLHTSTPHRHRSEHAPSIIFMDEVDSIGSARTDNSGGSGDSEVGFFLGGGGAGGAAAGAGSGAGRTRRHGRRRRCQARRPSSADRPLPSPSARYTLLYTGAGAAHHAGAAQPAGRLRGHQQDQGG